MVMLTDIHTIQAARALRSKLIPKIIEWDEDFNYIKDPSNQLDRVKLLKKLARLLKCNDPVCMFWTDSHNESISVGVEAHVYDSLKRLHGPHGRTLYKMLLVQTFGDSNENRNDTEASST